jgi:hypothetical protein
LAQIHHQPESTRDKLLQERIERQLNVITEQNFQKVIDTLPPYQAHILSTLREQTKERDRLIDAKRERNHTFERSR